MKNVFMIVHELDVNKGGMTTAMLERSKEFYNSGINADVITFDFKTNYNVIIDQLIKQGKMDSRTKMINMFNFFEEKSSSIRNKTNKKIYKVFKLLFKDTIEVQETKNISRYFNSFTGQYIAFKKESKNKNSYIIDTFNNNSRKERFYFFDDKVVKKDVFNNENKVICEVFFDKNSFPYLSRNLSPVSGAIGSIYLLNENKQFKNNIELSSFFIESIVKDSEKNVLICDGPGSFPKMLNTSFDKVKKFAVIHVNHFKNFDENGSVKKQENYIIENADNIDGVIVLTEAQKIDIIEQYKVKNIFVISNFIKNPDKIIDKVPNKKIGHISRMVVTKGINYLIEVAEQVVKVDNEVIFEIYGEGPEKENIEKLISDKMLNANVKLMGYTSKTSEVINTFDCVISTSQYEGQGLSMIEAMLHRKPLIAFDINYGPKDFLVNDFNGYLIENRNIIAMSEQILNLIQNPEKLLRLGYNAEETILNLYDSKKIMNKWKEILF
ncbi:glycosyltransferase [Exiguobacterium sp. s80]|uniref:glycosyltransferase n=1 Tax=Exiguobacterium sp. s80 TaxID=2751209 RepID=UPI001BECBAB1|nr:glycosyltransferase [Exiguobacterium sp. s80]